VDQQEQLQVDEDLGSLLIDELIPYSVEYYLGIKQEQLGEEGETEGKEKLAVTKADDEDFSDEEEEKPKAKASKPTKKKK
jgi:nucleosome assembly protein 1-like 1